MGGANRDGSKRKVQGFVRKNGKDYMQATKKILRRSKSLFDQPWAGYKTALERTD